jgi:aquaporin Z
MASSNLSIAAIPEALRGHWPEYLIEAWALGTFMLSAGVVTVLFEYPRSPLHQALPDADLRRALIGVAMGLTAIALIQSPWGKRSGAHMNPAVTLAFWRLGKVAGRDAFLYVVAQFAGSTIGVLVLCATLREVFTAPPVDYVITAPGANGVLAALVVEVVMSAGMMAMVLTVSASRRARWTPLLAGLLVALYITLAGPISGMSINPARSFASAFPAQQWTAYWIYVLAPLLGMQGAAAWYQWRRGREAVPCAKLLHTADQRCIHCGHIPELQGARQ